MKRVLIISNNCFSKTNSNGRTLGNLFYLYDKEKIAQFFISGQPDFTVCSNYYQVSDYDVLRSVLPFLNNKSASSKVVNPKRNAKNMLIRDFVWRLGWWQKKEYKKWLNDFRPEIVLLQMGDCTFMLKLAMQIAKKYGAKIFLYNTENYYFKEQNYFNDNHFLLYKLYISRYRKVFKKIIKKAEKTIYLCEKLRKVYDEEFHTSSVVIYNSTTLKRTDIQKDNFPVISYIGNLGLGRYKSLCDVADVLQQLGLKLNVYGQADDVILNIFSKYKSIIYHGHVSYEQVKEAIEKSHILFHVESFDEFYVNDTKYGFSGKIADSLASGKLFLIYADENIACSEYLKEHGINAVACNKKELELLLLKYTKSVEECKKVIEEEVALAEQNHSLIKNSQLFINALNEEKLDEN